MIALRCYRHLSVIVFGYVYFLHNGDESGVAYYVVGVVGQNRIRSVRTYANKSALISHPQNGMNGINLIVPFHVTLNRRSRSLNELFEKVVYLIIRTA